MLPVVLPAPDQPAPHPVHPPLVLVPVTPIIVGQATAIPTLEGLQLKVDTHLVPLHLVGLVEAFRAIFTAISLITVRLVNVVQVLLHVLHHQPADVAGGLLLVSSVQMFPQMDSTLEDFPAHMTGSCLTMFSVIVVEQGTVGVEESVALVTGHLNLLSYLLRVWSAFVSALIQGHRDFITANTLLVAEMNNSVVFSLLPIRIKHHAAVALLVILLGHHRDSVGEILWFFC